MNSVVCGGQTSVSLYFASRDHVTGLWTSKSPCPEGEKDKSTLRLLSFRNFDWYADCCSWVSSSLNRIRMYTLSAKFKHGKIKSIKSLAQPRGATPSYLDWTARGIWTWIWIRRAPPLFRNLGYPTESNELERMLECRYWFKIFIYSIYFKKFSA